MLRHIYMVFFSTSLPTDPSQLFTHPSQLIFYNIGSGNQICLCMYRRISPRELGVNQGYRHIVSCSYECALRRLEPLLLFHRRLTIPCACLLSRQLCYRKIPSFTAHTPGVVYLPLLPPPLLGIDEFKGKGTNPVIYRSNRSLQ
jgi:hypothetical protein